MLFSRRAIEEHIADWVEDRLAILLEHFAGERPIHATKLILPGAEDFILDAKTATARAEQVYRYTAAHAGFADWPVKLVSMGDEGPKDLGGVIVPSANTAAGAFSVDAKGDVEIRFSRDLMDQPPDLVSTFAHELAHLLLHSRQVEEGVSGEDAELMTDLAAVYLGFGVYLANSAFELQQFDDGLMGGWSSRRQGYLTENTLVYATAVFCAIQDDGFEDARCALKPRLQGVFDRACRQISRRGDQWGLFDLDRDPPTRTS